MSTRTHIVQRGDCMSSIARQYGFSDPSAVYGHADNADLRKARPNMNVLHPGDVVTIPDPQKKAFDCPSDATHKFKVKLAKKKLVLVLLDGEDKPLDGLPYELEVGDKVFKGSTDGGGKIEHAVDASAKSGTLKLGGGGKIPIQIGNLNPMKDCDDDGVSGAQARLANLGYSPGDADGVLGPRTRAALREYQRDLGLDPTGELSDDLLRRLEKAHGC